MRVLRDIKFLAEEKDAVLAALGLLDVMKTNHEDQPMRDFFAQRHGLYIKDFDLIEACLKDLKSQLVRL